MNNFWIICFFLTFSIFAQEDSIKAKGFKVPEYDEKGKLSSIISGEHGTIFGKEAKIKGVLVEIFNTDSPLKLKTPACSYNMKKKICTSKESVQINGDGVQINGVGFDINNNTKKIFIRSQVKVVWKKANLKSSTQKKEETQK
ncbi:MAG: LPS export ABC transporter periplasmic protein LptC [Lentisphaeraceae bacterium]|nr:LPS export ABC transporter periplasmic protein LptC [Lentisphaeraceae bacterium]